MHLIQTASYQALEKKKKRSPERTYGNFSLATKIACRN